MTREEFARLRKYTQLVELAKGDTRCLSPEEIKDMTHLVEKLMEEQGIAIEKEVKP